MPRLDRLFMEPPSSLSGRNLTSLSVSSDALSSLPGASSLIISISFHKGQKKHWLQTASASSLVTNLPCSRGKEHQAWLPAAGRVNTGRTEINHLSSTCPDTFSKALPPATKGDQAARSHPWLWQLAWGTTSLPFVSVLKSTCFGVTHIHEERIVIHH